MSQKVRKTLIMIVMAALIICLMAASLTYTFTYGRYAGGKFDEEKSPYGDLIEFVGAREYTVRSPEELIQAIKDGYSNIVIAEDAEEPFVITEGVTDVEANLVLNLNGKVVVRNSRNPMLDVQTNVSVVLVYDSTNKGAFYNPVGSSLMASGGSLTVGSGGYESGPRAEEYQGKEAAGTLGSDTNVTLFARSNETNNETNAVTSPTNLDRSKYVSGYSLVSGVSLPTITPKTTQENNRKTVRGNVYLSSDHSAWLPADTFLVYTVEENCFIGDDTSSGNVTFVKDQLYVNAEREGDVISASEFISPECNVASCDFYYYYPIDENGSPINSPGSIGTPQDYAVIYGYWDVMALARDDLPEGQTQGMATALKGNGLIHPYGAVRMVEGEGIVRGGTFSNHFDAVNTYGIYAEGGTLSVSENTTVETTFTTGGEGVCIRVQSATGETTTTGEATTTGGSLTISGGEFSSEIGNTIEMSGGKMTVTAGTFRKDASAATTSTDNGSAIDIQGGTLSMTGSDAKTFTITGSHVNGIKSSGGGTVTAENATFSLNGGGENGNNYGTDMFGINIDSGKVEANGCEITIYGTYSAGILSAGNANVSLGATNRRSEIAVWIPTDNGAEKKLSSSGVSSEGGSITLTGNVLIDTNGLGITARGLISISKGETEVYTDYGTGVLVSGEAGGDAKIVVAEDAVLSVDSKIDSDWGWVLAPGHEDEGETIEAINKNNGIYVENGSIDASKGTLNVTHTGVAGDEPDNNSTTGAATKSYAVFVKGDTASNNQTTSVSIGAGTITGTNAGGVYVVGRKEGEDYTATVTLGGVTVTAQSTYAAGILTETGNVIIDGNAQITSSALGIAVINGNVGIGLNNQNVSASVKATRATGIYVQGGTVTNSGTLGVTSTISSTWENEGADFDNTSFKTSRFNGIFVNGGSLESTGTLKVTFTGVANDAPGSGDNISDLNGFTAYRLFEIKSYAVRVEGTTGTTVEITSGSITNSVGGGVLVNGGKVTLGKKETTNDVTTYSGPTVQTTGTELYYDETSNWISDQLYDAYSDVSSEANGKSWKYLLSSEGGPAIKIVGGTLSVYGGKYEAQQGDGIVTNGGSSYIHNGEFIGKDSYTILDDSDGIRFLKIEGDITTTSPLAGPAASYAFKVYGGTANVYGGTFGDPKSTSGASGAFVMGTSATNTGTANTNIYGGTFDVSNSGTSGGQAGFSAYVYTNVTFEENGSDEIGKGGKIQVQGLAAGLTLESAGAGDNNPYQGGSAQVTIKGGEFSSTKDENNSDGIWYGNGLTTLNISGGTFTGAARSGLYFEANPGNNVQLSGGTYYGPKNDVYARGYVVFFDHENRTTNNAIQGNNMNLLYQNLLLDSSQYYAYGDVEAARSNFDLGSDVSYSISREYGEMQYTNDKGLARLRYGIWYDQVMVYSKITINHR